MTANAPKWIGDYHGTEWGYCICCGKGGATGYGVNFVEKDGTRHWRCQKHADRNPCILPGCHHTYPAKGTLSTDNWICSEHWRRYVPPRSPVRRAYQRFFREAKRTGWTKPLRVRFWRFWDGLLKRVLRLAVEGDLDQDAIERMFGLNEDG